MSTMEPRRETVRGDLCETKRLEDSDFVLVSFWGGVIVVDYRHARVEEDQGEAGRENDA